MSSTNRKAIASTLASTWLVVVLFLSQHLPGVPISFERYLPVPRSACWALTLCMYISTKLFDRNFKLKHLIIFFFTCVVEPIVYRNSYRRRPGRNRRNWRCRLKIGCRRDERSRVGKQMNATMLSSLYLGTRRKSYFRGYIYIQFTLQCSITNTNVFFF